MDDIHLRLPVPATAEEIVAKLREEYGWTEDMMTPDMLECIGEIAAALAEDR